MAALAIVYLAEEVSPHIRSFTMGIWGVAGSLAGGLAFLLAPLFELPTDRWRWLFGLSMIGSSPFRCWRRFLRESRAFQTPVDRPPVLAVLTGETGRYFWPLAIAGLAVGAFSGPAVSFATDYLINDLNWSVLVLQPDHHLGRGARRNRIAHRRTGGRPVGAPPGHRAGDGPRRHRGRRLLLAAGAAAHRVDRDRQLRFEHLRARLRRPAQLSCSPPRTGWWPAPCCRR